MMHLGQNFFGLDLWLMHHLSGLQGDWYLERIVLYLSGNQLLKGFVLIATYWYYWFGGVSSSVDKQEARRAVLAGIVACMVAVILSRLLANIMPYRIRPLTDPASDFHRFAETVKGGYVDWSSFPSDHAAFVFAVSLALYRIAPKVSLTLAGYSAVIVCLPRVYLGIHYPSDVVIGAGIGAFAAWFCEKFVKGRWVDAVLEFPRRQAAWFYLSAFIVSSEVARMLDDGRQTGQLAAAMLRQMSAGAGMLLIGACAGLLLIGSLVTVILIRRIQPGKKAAANSDIG